MKKNYFIHLLYVIAVLCLLVSCENWDDDADNVKQPVNKELLSGYVQKGPFISGSSVTIVELDYLLNPTGRTYSTIVIDNSGNFEEKNIELVSRYAQMKAEGYYFNENTGEISIGQLNLDALVDLAESDHININVLTHLERPRVEYLVREENKSFADAKKQAQKEVLHIFGIDMSNALLSESLNLTNSADLLAVSCILQGPLAVGELVELMTKISSDIRTDGTLDNQALGARLADNAYTLPLTDIRKNMEKLYTNMDSPIIVPDFERSVQQFLESTGLQASFITYPAEGAWGPNVLSDEVTSVFAGQDYSMIADILPKGFRLSVIVKGGLWYYGAIPAPINWEISTYDYSNETQEFRIIESNKPNDLLFTPTRGELDNADGKYYITLEIYENYAKEPTRTKRVEILSPPPPESDVDSTWIFFRDVWPAETIELQERNKKKVSISEGIYGTLVFSEGNCTEIDENSSCNQYPVIKEIMIYEYLTVKNAQYARNIPNVFHDISGKLVAIVIPDEDGFFEVSLSPGVYSVLIKDGQSFYVNTFDAKGGLAPVYVNPSDVTVKNLNIIYASQ